MIIYRDPGGIWTDGSDDGEDGGGYDPAFSDPATEEAGHVAALSIVKTAAGYEGAVGNGRSRSGFATYGGTTVAKSIEAS